MSGAPTLYYARRSSALPARLALDLAGADYQLERMDLTQGHQCRPAHLARNAFGRVPVLVAGDFVLTENVAILPYIARRYTAAGLWPATPEAEARCLEWLGWGASILHPALAHARRPERYAATPEGRADVVATAQGAMAGLFDITEQRLGEARWSAGADMSIADLYLLFFWLWGPGPASGNDVSARYPRWTTIAARLVEQPAIRGVLQDDAVPGF